MRDPALTSQQTATNGALPKVTDKVTDTHRTLPHSSIPLTIPPYERDAAQTLLASFEFLGVSPFSVRNAILFSLGYVTRVPEALRSFPWAAEKKKLLSDTANLVAEVRALSASLAPELEEYPAPGDVSQGEATTSFARELGVIRGVLSYIPGVGDVKTHTFRHSQAVMAHVLRSNIELDGTLLSQVRAMRQLRVHPSDWRLWYQLHRNEVLTEILPATLQPGVKSYLCFGYPKHVSQQADAVAVDLLPEIDRALTRYNPLRATLSTFLSKRIVGGVVDWLRRQDYVGRFDRAKLEQAKRELSEATLHLTDAASPETSLEIVQQLARRVAARELLIRERTAVSLDGSRSADAPSLAVHLPAAAEEPADTLAAKQVLANLRARIHRLVPPEHAEMVTLRFEGGLRLRDIAARLGVPESSVSNIVGRAVRKLFATPLELEPPSPLDRPRYVPPSLHTIVEELYRRAREEVRISNTDDAAFARAFIQSLPYLVSSQERPHIIANTGHVTEQLPYNKRASTVIAVTGEEFGWILARFAAENWQTPPSRPAYVRKPFVLWQDFPPEWCERSLQPPTPRGLYAIPHLLQSSFCIGITLDVNRYSADQLIDADDFFHAWASQNGARATLVAPAIPPRDTRWLGYTFTRSPDFDISRRQWW